MRESLPSKENQRTLYRPHDIRRQYAWINGLDDTAANATQVKGLFNGRCGIISDSGKASLITAPNDAGWVAGPAPLPSSQAINVDWFY